MVWTWNWWFFGGATIVLAVMSMFSRGVMNAANVAKYGPEADYRHNPVMAILGSVAAGATYAAIATALVGFVI